MPSLDSERPFDCWNTDLNVFAVGGAADGDWPSGSKKGNRRHGYACFLNKGPESVDGRTVAQPSAPTEFVYVNAVADLLFVDIQLWFPPADNGERGCPRKHP